MPFKIAYRQQIIDIVEVDKPHKDYIILESLSSDEKKIFYVINTEKLTKSSHSWGKNFLKIGRGQDSDVRLVDDISVSRSHAFIHRDHKGYYYLTDNKSKFGTLLQIQYPFYLSANNFIEYDEPLVI